MEGGKKGTKGEYIPVSNFNVHVDTAAGGSVVKTMVGPYKTTECPDPQKTHQQGLSFPVRTSNWFFDFFLHIFGSLAEQVTGCYGLGIMLESHLAFNSKNLDSTHLVSFA